MRASPRVGAREPGEDRDQRRLAGAVGPEQPEELASAHREAHAVERLHVAEAARDVDDFDGGGHGSGRGGTANARRSDRGGAARPSHATRMSSTPYRSASAVSAAGTSVNVSGRPSAVARRLSASSTATAAESTAPMPDRSISPAVGSGSAGAAAKHGRRRWRTSARRRRPSARRRRSAGMPRPALVAPAALRHHFAATPLFRSASVLMRPSTPPFLICSLNSSR